MVHKDSNELLLLKRWGWEEARWKSIKYSNIINMIFFIARMSVAKNNIKLWTTFNWILTILLIFCDMFFWMHSKLLDKTGLWCISVFLIALFSYVSWWSNNKLCSCWEYDGCRVLNNILNSQIVLHSSTDTSDDNDGWVVAGSVRRVKQNMGLFIYYYYLLT